MTRTMLWCAAAAAGLWAAVASAGEDVTYRKDIKPLFDAKCASCHGKDSAPEKGDFKEARDKWMAAGKGMRMDTYSHLLSYVAWPDTGALMRRLDDGKATKDGKPGNMNQYLGKTDEEAAKNLALFKAWVGNWTLKRSKEIAREDLEAIRARY